MADSTITRQSISNSTSISSFLNMLKEDYIPRIDDWVHNESGPLPKLLMKKKGTMGGKKTLTAAFTGSPQGVGFSAEGYDLPEPSASSSIQPEILGKELSLRHRLTFESQQVARKSSAAFAKPRAEEMRLLRQELALRIAKNLHHGPYDISGRIDSASTTTLTMTPQNSRRYTSSLFFASGNKYIRPNQLLQNIDVSKDTATATIASASAGLHTLGTLTTGCGVSSLGGTAAAPTVVMKVNPATAGAFNDGAACAVGDFLIPFASRDDDAVGVMLNDAPPTNAITAISSYHGMNGLANINTDSTLYTALFGLLKTDASGLLARADHNSGTQRAFTDRMVEFFLTGLESDTGGAPSKLVLDPFTMLEVTKEYRNLRQFSPIIGKAGSKDVAVVRNDLTLPYVTDRLCLPGLMWAIDPSSYGYYEWFPLQSPDSGGTRWVANKAQEEIILMKGGNVFCEAPWKNGVLDDFIFDTTALT